MKSQSSRFLERLLVTSSTELLASYGVAVTRTPAAPATPKAQLEQSSGGIIRFSGEMISGSLFVAGSFNFLAACRPRSLRSRPLAASSVTDWIFVRDWAMELTNQLLGRIRNDLYVYGVTVEVRSPTAVSGHSLGVSIRERESEPLRFVTSSGDAMMVWLDTVTGAPFEAAVVAKPAASVSIPKEGDVLLF